MRMLFVTMPPTLELESLPAPANSWSPPLSPVIPNQPSLETHLTLSVAAEQSQQDVQIKNRVFNYYFLLLALLVVALAALFLWMHRRRQREQQQIRLSGQRALLRDVERWAILRRNQIPAVEGLNASGEAPPPYKPKDDVVLGLGHTETTTETPAQVTIPTRALWRSSSEHARPPTYVETFHMRNNNGELGTTRSAT